MEHTIAVVNHDEIAKNPYFRTVIRYSRAAVLTLALPFLLNFSLSGCDQSDTIAPVITSSGEVQHLAAREAVSLLNIDLFESSKFGSFWLPELRTSTAGLPSKEQHRVGKQSMRFSWKPSQYDGTNASCHSELATQPLQREDSERWYGYSMYLPSATMANDDQIANILQWHALPDPNFHFTVPPIAVELQPGNKLVLAYRASEKPIITVMQHPTSQKIISLGTAQFDKWIDYVVHIKWDPSYKTGVLQVWQNGVQVINEQNISIGYVQTRPYWKIGLYCWTGKSSHNERTLYYDEVRIGGPSANYAAVKPGRSNNN